MSNQIQNPNVKMFSKTINYLSFPQHINESGHSGYFPLLQRGIEACPGATWWLYVVAWGSSYARSASLTTYQGQVWARGDFSNTAWSYWELTLFPIVHLHQCNLNPAFSPAFSRKPMTEYRTSNTLNQYLNWVKNISYQKHYIRP